jgi:Kelch motif/Galactose oxidase, central domain
MNKQPSSTIITRLCWGVFFLVLLFLAVQVIPPSLGQTRSSGSKQSLAAPQMPQVPPLATGAVSRRPNPVADSVLNHVRSGPSGPAESRPLVPPHQIEGINCDSEPGIVIHDDGGIENGYSGNPALVSEVRFADKFTPSSYPASYTSVCLDFVIVAGGPATYPIDVVVFDDDGAGGSPGTLLGELNGQTATTHLFVGGGQPPIWNSYDISSLAINVTSGSVYIGARWVPPVNNVFLSADESGPVGFAGGYWWNNFDGVWSPTQNAFPGYTANMIRAVEAGGGGTPTPTPTATPTPTPPPCGTAKLYNIAGFNLGGQTTTTRIYDIPTDTWTTGAPIPEPSGLSDHATAYWDGKIYVAAGFNGSSAINTLRAYDIATDSWSTLAPLPQALFLPGFGIINGKLYIASGNDGFVELNTLYIYDIATNTWTTGANVPTPVTGPGSAVYQGKLYLFGGGFPTTLTITQIFDPGTNTWTTGPSMNVSRLWFYGGAIDDTSIVAPGGDTIPGIPINVNEQLTASWAVKAPLPFNARGPFAVSDGTFVYIGGGYDGSTVHTDTLRYDPVANSYTTLAPAPDAHFLSQAVIVSQPCPGEIRLRFAAHLRDGFKVVQLKYIGATSPTVDVFRNGALLATADNDGTYVDVLTVRGIYTYQVCEAGTTNCSNEVEVRFRGP